MKLLKLVWKYGIVITGAILATFAIYLIASETNLLNYLKENNTIMLTIVVLIGLAFYNVYMILWKTEKETNKSKKYSKIWHGLGLAIRIILYAIPFFYFTNWLEITKWSLLFISIGGIMYDFIINLMRWIYNGKPDIWYVDNKGWNSVFLKFLSPKLYWIIRGLFVLATIVFFII